MKKAAYEFALNELNKEAAGVIGRGFKTVASKGKNFWNLLSGDKLKRFQTRMATQPHGKLTMVNRPVPGVPGKFRTAWGKTRDKKQYEAIAALVKRTKAAQDAARFGTGVGATALGTAGIGYAAGGQ